METEKSAEDFTLYEIQKDDENLVNPVLSSTGVASNFTCFPQFYAFLRKPTNRLYLCELNDRKRILLHRTTGINDVRILFSKSPDDEKFIEAIKAHFQPQYIAYNFIPAPQVNSRFLPIRTELTLSVPTIANLVDKKVARDYRRCEGKHLQLKYVPALLEHKAGIVNFLDEWCRTVGPTLGQNVTAENDRQFINLFLGTSTIEGGVVFDADKIVGIAFHAPHPSNPEQLAVKIILKNLRGYTKLGEWLTVKEACQLQESGFAEALTGGIEVPSQERFKRHFMLNGRENTYYSGVVFQASDIKIGENYLRDVWA